MALSSECRAEELRGRDDNFSQIRSIRHVVCQGFCGFLWSSERPCCDPNYGRARETPTFISLQKKSHKNFEQIQLAPLNGATSTPTRGALALEGAALGESVSAAVYWYLKHHDETPFWIVKVMKVAPILPLNYSVPVILLTSSLSSQA